MQNEQLVSTVIQQVLFSHGKPMHPRDVVDAIDPYRIADAAVIRMIYRLVDEKKLLWLPDFRVALAGWPGA